MPHSEFDQEVEKFRNYYSENIKIFEKAADFYRSIINSLVADNIIVQNINYRVKDWEECISKFNRKYRSKLEETEIEYEIREYITDLIGIRIVCLYEVDIANIREILEKNFQVIEVTDKIAQIESTDNQFGYKSLHLDLKLNDERKKLPEYKNFADFSFEVQVRTMIQDAWSVLDHKIKYKKTPPPELKRRINRLAALFEIADSEFLLIKEETEKLEKNARIKGKVKELLNVISFLEIVDKIFPDYHFLSYKADGFVQEILDISDNISVEAFKNTLEKQLLKVQEYKDHVHKTTDHRLNPYTVVRHCLYLSDNKVFKDIIFNNQKRSFEDWLSKK